MIEVGIIVAALLAGVAVLVRSQRVAAWATLGALGLTPVLVLSQIWDSDQLRPLRDRPSLFLAAGVVALAAVGIAAGLVSRWPALLPMAAMLALPFRIPIASAGVTSNLLVPLYFVIAAGALAWAVPRLRGGADEQEQERQPGDRRLEWALVAFIVLYAVQASYSDDVDKALNQVAFFYVPFALLYAMLRRIEWTSRLLLWCLGILIALAIVFVGVGFWEYQARELLLNPKVIDSNQFESYFRVNSLFFDPNIYGRFLAIVMLAIAAVVIWTYDRRTVIAGGALLALLWAGLVLTFSQSSFAALLAGLAVLAALRWSARWTGVVVLAAVVIGAGFVVASPSSLHLELGSSKSVDSATSGRADLIEGGVELFAQRPVQGWGAGSFSRAYRRERHVSSTKAVSASHTIPITVAAEQGVAGLLLYAAVLVFGLIALFRRARDSVASAAIAAAFVALLVHTMLYAAFLEDPLAWVLLGIGVALGVRPPADSSTVAEDVPAHA
jgi:O-antigen ligase